MNGNTSIDAGVEMAIRLRQACEVHDAGIANHLDRVSRYSSEIARLMGWPTARLIELHYAAPLHDIGKIGLPASLLNKPGRITEEERELIKTHTLLGYKILEGSAQPVIFCAAQIALSHHECWDGSGYPHRMAGREIPAVARIVAVADVYDALVSKRAYKAAWAEERVLEEMRQLRGSKFDPEILDVFLAHIEEMALPVERLNTAARRSSSMSMPPFAPA